MSTWLTDAVKMMHKSEGCKFVPWHEDGKFMYAVCYTCDSQITPDEWNKRRKS